MVASALLVPATALLASIGPVASPASLVAGAAPAPDGESRREARTILPTFVGPAVAGAEQKVVEREDAHTIRRDPIGGGHRAWNPRQGYGVHFDDRGFDVFDARAPGAVAWGLELAAWDGVDVGGAPPRAESSDGAMSRRTAVSGPRLQREVLQGLDEWFFNRSDALEHGFTVAHDVRPHTELVLELDLRGPLRACTDASGPTALSFVDPNGRERLTYSGLVAFDASGRGLDARFEIPGEHGGRRIAIHVDDADAVHPLTIDPIVELVYVKATNTDSGDQLGQSVDLDGSIAIVGADLEGSGATGVDGDQTDNSVGNAGAVYVLHRNGPSWGHDTYLKASNTDAFDRFGSSVGVSGSTIVVAARSERSASTGVNGDESDNSAPNSGAAYVFEAGSGAWAQTAYLKASNAEENDVFGFAVAIDGDTIAIGAPDEASASALAPFDRTDNSAPSAGAVYVFVRSGSTWVEQAYLKASDALPDARFGWDVALEGDTLVVGAPDADPGGAPRTGAVYVFTRNAGTWIERARLAASNGATLDRFGHSVALDGNTLVVGATGEQSGASEVGGDQLDDSLANAGAAYVFVGAGSAWSQEAYLKASVPGQSDEFGHDVAIDGNLVVVGAHREASASSGIDSDATNNFAFMTGAAYLFTRNGTTWTFDAYLKGPDTDIFDVFGTSVAIDGTTVLIGSAGEDGAGVGIAADPSDDGASSAGAAFAYEVEYWAVLPGCFGNTAAFAEPVSPARVGTAVPLALSTSVAIDGVVAPYFGAVVADAFGCGALVPGLGEVLLALAPFPKALPVEPLVAGAADVPFLVPDVPAFAGLTVALQAFAVDTTTFAAEVSNAVLLEIRP